MQAHSNNSTSRSLSRDQQLREAVLLIFCEPLPAECMRLQGLSQSEWKRLLHWLDTSGLALYFLDRIMDMGVRGMLPQPVLARLQRNLADNTERMSEMIAESVAIQRRFQTAGVSYAVVKGFSLWPESVPRMELRSQLDLDFLVARNSAEQARALLEENGYYLQAISGRSWEFKSKKGRTGTLKDLYKPGLTRSVELHLEASPTGATNDRSQLADAQMRASQGIDVPVLSPVDLFLGQGLHLYKHTCSEFARTAHLIEFRRHILARHGDRQFWSQLREQAAGEPSVCMRLGIVILLISRVMGSFAPAALTQWTVDTLPTAAKQWVDLYGKRTVLATFPGSKLYLLLQKELEVSGVPAKRSVANSLLPRRLPPAIARGEAGEALPARLKRYRKQIHFILFRLRFHAVQGVSYFVESIRWRYCRDGVAH
jgi:hypothetical protein